MSETAFHLISTSRLDALESKITRLETALRSQLDHRIGHGNDWITQGEAQQLLDCARSTLHRYRREGTIPYSRVGRKIFFRRADVESLLQEHLTQTGKTGGPGEFKCPSDALKHKLEADR